MFNSVCKNTKIYLYDKKILGHPKARNKGKGAGRAPFTIYNPSVDYLYSARMPGTRSGGGDLLGPFPAAKIRIFSDTAKNT